MSDLTEEQARQMEAGEELDRICAEWMAPDWAGNDDWWSGVRGDSKYSTDWSAAGPLLQAIVHHEDVYVLYGTGELLLDPCGFDRTEAAFCGPLNPESISIVTAVLVARGITREEVEGE